MIVRRSFVRIAVAPLLALPGAPLVAQQAQVTAKDPTVVYDSPLADYERTEIYDEGEELDPDYRARTRRPSVLPGATGQPRLDPLLVRDPLARLSTRVNNRIENRLQMRLDRANIAAANPASSYASAESQTRKRQTTPR